MAKKEDILNKLIGMGLSAEEIQKAYERYLWHEEFYTKTVKERMKIAYAEANNAIYFNDNSDYLSALYEVCKALNPTEEKNFGKKYIEIK